MCKWLENSYSWRTRIRDGFFHSGLVHRAIELQERLIALTKELKKALLHKLFTEGLRGEPQKLTEIGPVPESWRWCR